MDSLPPVANLMPYLSFLKWSFQALCINEFRGENFNCDPNAPEGTGCEPTGEVILDRLTFGGSTTGNAIMGLCLVLTGLFLVAFLLLYRGGLVFAPLGHVGSRYLLDEKAKAIEQAKNESIDDIELQYDYSGNDDIVEE